MRLIPTAVFCASLALPGLAHAQAQKITGASLAGLCAASLEFVAGARASLGEVDPRHLEIMQSTRDLYLQLASFPQGEIQGYAQAWSERMGKNLSEAVDDTARGTVATRIGRIARDCQEQMIAQYRAAEARGEIPPLPPQPIPAQPAPVQPLTVQPLQAQPLQVQPLTVQPLESQPLIINPQ